MWGDTLKNSEIPFIETLSGKYSGKNVLEGFCRNTEILCNEDDISQTFDESFYNMCVEDNMISCFYRAQGERSTYHTPQIIQTG